MAQSQKTHVFQISVIVNTISQYTHFMTNCSFPTHVHKLKKYCIWSSVIVGVCGALLCPPFFTDAFLCPTWRRWEWHSRCIPSLSFMDSSFAGDRVSNSISQSIHLLLSFSITGLFFFFFFLHTSPFHLHRARNKQLLMQLLQLPVSLLLFARLNYKILAAFSVKIAHRGRPDIIWSWGFVTENNTMQLGFRD